MLGRTSLVILVVSIALAMSLPLHAGTPLPQGIGLAARYPNDAGIAKDPAVIFADSFESGKVKWDEQQSPSATSDRKRVHSGK